jgi:hypothetical protein
MQSKKRAETENRKSRQNRDIDETDLRKIETKTEQRLETKKRQKRD